MEEKGCRGWKCHMLPRFPCTVAKDPHKMVCFHLSLNVLMLNCYIIEAHHNRMFLTSSRIQIRSPSYTRQPDQTQVFTDTLTMVLVTGSSADTQPQDTICSCPASELSLASFVEAVFSCGWWDSCQCRVPKPPEPRGCPSHIHCSNLIR